MKYRIMNLAELEADPKTHLVEGGFLEGGRLWRHSDVAELSQSLQPNMVGEVIQMMMEATTTNLQLVQFGNHLPGVWYVHNAFIVEVK